MQRIDEDSPQASTADTTAPQWEAPDRAQRVGQRKLEYWLTDYAMEGPLAPVLGAKAHEKSKFLVWQDVVDEIGADTPVLMLEFGVWKGGSLRWFSERFSNPGSEFHGFDSFEGLPETWMPHMQKGHFSTGGEMPVFDDPRVTLHKGWIQNTLPALTPSLERKGRTVLVHVDTDIYSAALFQLTWLWREFDRMHVLFDEFLIDEALALADFMSAYPVEARWYSRVDSQHRKIEQLAGELRRVPYAP